MLRVGFVGLGFISHENVLGYLGSPDAKIVAVCDPDESRARQWLGTYELEDARYYRDDGDMLEHESLDIVEILTPHHLHYEQVMRCAQAGIRGISLQKPMAPRLVECKEMIDLCRRNGVVLKIYENYLFYPVYVRAKQMLDDGLLGDLISIRANTLSGKRDGAPLPPTLRRGSWRSDFAKAGTSPLVGDDGFHKFSLARWIMGRDIETIGAWIDAETAFDAPALIRARFARTKGEHTRYAQFDFSFSSHMGIPFDFWLDDFVEIVGEGGIMWINQCAAAGDRREVQGNRMSESPVFPPIVVYRDGTVSTDLANMSLHDRNWSTSFIASTRHFIDVMRRGGDPVFTGEDGMEITRYTVAALVSAQWGRDVSLDEITVESETNGTFKLSTNFLNLPPERA